MIEPALWVTAFALALLTGASSLASAAEPLPSFSTERHRVQVRTLVTGLEQPWGVAFLPDGRFLITERPGRLRIASPGGELDPRPVSGVPRVAARGQGGLLDVALHPNFTDTPWVYLSYSGSGPRGYGTEVARGRLVGHRLTDLEVLFRALPKSTGGRHFGSRLLFDRAGWLYITLGERGVRARAQDLSDHAGSIIRLGADGKVPVDNPFANATGDRSGARPEIFSYGHRNVQGIALGPGPAGVAGALWAHEHGPQGGDEVNRIEAGINYGWPVITYGRNYFTGTAIGEGQAKPGMAQPIHQWTPSIAPSGMAFYSGSRFKHWAGNIFVGALKFQLVARLELRGGKIVHEERLFKGVFGRVRDVREGPDGYLYFLTDASAGVLARIEPTR